MSTTVLAGLPPHMSPRNFYLYISPNNIIGFFDGFSMILFPLAINNRAIMLPNNIIIIIIIIGLNGFS